MVDASVIVPVYNVKQYLKTCVESVCSQTVKNIEIILVDDGSRDGSGEMCDELAKADERISVIHQDNAGQGAARNRAMAKARGEYICFVDSDDAILPHELEDNIALARKYDADIVNFGYRDRFVSAEGELIAERNEVVPKLEGCYSFEAFWQNFLDAQGTYFTCRIFRRDYIEKNGLHFAETKMGEDNYFLACVYDTPFHNIVFNREAYYLYSLRPHSSMTSFHWDVFDPRYAGQRVMMETAVKHWEPKPGIYRDYVNENRLASVHTALKNVSFARSELTMSQRVSLMRVFCSQQSIFMGLYKCKREQVGPYWQWLAICMLRKKQYKRAIRYYDTLQYLREVRNRLNEAKLKKQKREQGAVA